MFKPSVNLRSCIWQPKTFDLVRSQVGDDFGYPSVNCSATEVGSCEDEKLSHQNSVAHSDTEGNSEGTLGTDHGVGEWIMNC